MLLMEPRYPKHIKKIVQSIQDGTDVHETLAAALPSLPTDPALQAIFERLGYSKGQFPKSLSSLELLSEIDSEYEKPAEPNKGLKFLSSKVKEIVSNKGLSTYREVAEELITQNKTNSKEGKNVLRRVYDALNVLIAVGVIAKTSRRYTWQGLGKGALQERKAILHRKRFENQHKKEILASLSSKFYSLQELIDRNKNRRIENEKIKLPLIIIATEETPNNHIRMECNENRTKLAICIEKPMVIVEDTDLIQKLNLNFAIPEELNQILNSSIFFN